MRRVRSTTASALSGLRDLGRVRLNETGSPVKGTPVLWVSGAADPIVPAVNAARLATELNAAGATVTHRVLPVGHGLSQADVTVTSAWLKGQAQ